MRPFVAAALTAVVLAVAPACGPGSTATSSTAPAPSTNRANVLLTAASATRAAGSARVGMAMTMPSAAGTIRMHGTGLFRLGTPALGELRLSMSAAGRSFPMEERIIGTVFYMRSPVFAQQLPAGKRWLKFDLSAMGSAGSALSSAMNNGTSDPTQTLTYLQATADSIQNLGSEDIGGASTTHYHAVVIFKKAVELLVQRASPAQRPALRRLYAQFESQTGVTDYPADVWVDSAGLVRKMHYSMPMTTTGEAMDVTMTMSHFGTPVHVAAPPAGQVADLSRMAAAAQQQ
ncbi:MAG TPA: hypothetical protein VE824_01220, partial [Gaiellales bacterium]|nr:hypothetical protein [Gaiellales bacterium]